MREGAPFVGRSGEELNIGLGGNREGVYITNVRKCLGNEGESSTLREASIAHCTSSYLAAEFAHCVGASTLLVVGADALQVAASRRDVTKCHGSVWSRAEVEGMRGVQTSD